MVSVNPAVTQKKEKERKKPSDLSIRPIDMWITLYGWLSKFKTGDGGIRNECVL